MQKKNNNKNKQNNSNNVNKLILISKISHLYIILILIDKLMLGIYRNIVALLLKLRLA